MQSMQGSPVSVGMQIHVPHSKQCKLMHMHVSAEGPLCVQRYVSFKGSMTPLLRGLRLHC
jgi:hypothetical protein